MLDIFLLLFFKHTELYFWPFVASLWKLDKKELTRLIMPKARVYAERNQVPGGIFHSIPLETIARLVYNAITLRVRKVNPGVQ